MSLLMKEEFQHIIRVMNTNLDGKQNILYAITKVRRERRTPSYRSLLLCCCYSSAAAAFAFRLFFFFKKKRVLVGVHGYEREGNLYLSIVSMYTVSTFV